MLGTERSADADPNLHGFVAEDIGAAAKFGDRAQAEGTGVGRAAAADDDEEFVAADPRRDVALGHPGAEPVGDLAQQAVAGAVAERVVDPLEAVEIQEQIGDVIDSRPPPPAGRVPRRRRRG